MRQDLKHAFFATVDSYLLRSAALIPSIWHMGRAHSSGFWKASLITLASFSTIIDLPPTLIETIFPYFKPILVISLCFGSLVSELKVNVGKFPIKGHLKGPGGIFFGFVKYHERRTNIPKHRARVCMLSMWKNSDDNSIFREWYVGYERRTICINLVCNLKRFSIPNWGVFLTTSVYILLL